MSRYILHTPNFSDKNGAFRISSEGLTKVEFVQAILENEILNDNRINRIPSMQIADLDTFFTYGTASQRNAVNNVLELERYYAQRKISNLLKWIGDSLRKGLLFLYYKPNSPYSPISPVFVIYSIFNYLYLFLL
jgi:hypothetical protein